MTPSMPAFYLQRLLAACAVGLLGCDRLLAQGDDALTIGSAAPALSIDHWFDSKIGDKPVEEFKSGDIYLVEFWATWCPPCVASMPHLAELQEKHAEQGVTVVSVSNEDLETIESFLEGEVRNYEGDAEETPTYAELTSAYRLTGDPDGSMSDDWMEAAGQNGIPTSFLVGKTGQIEWIGHPMSVDPILEEVIAGTWDREAFAKEFRERQRLQLLQREVMMAMREGGAEGALKVIEEFRASAESPEALEIADRLEASVGKQVFLSEIGSDPAVDVQRFDEILAPVKEEPAEVNELTWLIYRYAAADRGVGKDLLKAAADAAEAALDLDGPKGSLLDTAAHLQHELGNLDRAIELQTRAVEAEEVAANPAALEQLQQYLDELKAERDGDSDEGEDS